jgi:hypothetical protein
VTIRPALLLVLAVLSTAALALDRKHRDGSVPVTPDKAALDFLGRYEHAINTKSTREFTTRLAPIRPVEGCAQAAKSNITPIAHRPGQRQALDCARRRVDYPIRRLFSANCLDFGHAST